MSYGRESLDNNRFAFRSTPRPVVLVPTPEQVGPGALLRFFSWHSSMRQALLHSWHVYSRVRIVSLLRLPLYSSTEYSFHWDPGYLSWLAPSYTASGRTRCRPVSGSVRLVFAVDIRRTGPFLLGPDLWREQVWCVSLNKGDL